MTTEPLTLESGLSSVARKLTRQERKRLKKEIHDAEIMQPREAALDMEPEFRSMAKHLAKGDTSIQDDLVQEMALGCLLANEPQSRSMFRLLAAWRARDWIRWWLLEFQNRAEHMKKKPRLDAEDRPLTSKKLEKACEALNRMLKGQSHLVEPLIATAR